MEKSFVFLKLSKNIIKEYKNLEYVNRTFNDQNTIDKWKSLGHDYPRYTGLMRDQSKELPNWCFNLSKEIPLKKSTITLYCMLPGTIMPEHGDKFMKYREIMNLCNNDDIGRAIVFLEDWKSGHYFEINSNPIVNWKKGDCIWWKNDTPHMAANLGKENRYTMQVTGIL